MEDPHTKAVDWFMQPYTGDVWATTTTTTVTPLPTCDECLTVHMPAQPWRCEYCGTTHGGLEYSPCRNCGAPARVSVSGAQR